METTREQRAKFVKDVVANLAVDNLIPNQETQKLFELYISGRYSISEIIEQAKNDLEKRLADRKLSTPLNDDSPIPRPMIVTNKPTKSAKNRTTKAKAPNHGMST
jgi:hypothetical protein